MKPLKEFESEKIIQEQIDTLRQFIINANLSTDETVRLKGGDTLAVYLSDVDSIYRLSIDHMRETMAAGLQRRQ